MRLQRPGEDRRIAFGEGTVLADDEIEITGFRPVDERLKSRLDERLRSGANPRELRADLVRLERSFERHLEAMQQGILEVRMVPLGQVWVHTHPFTAAVATQGFGKQFTEFGEANRKVFTGACRLFDAELAKRDFIAADRYTMADIVMQTTFDFGRFIGVDIADDQENLKAWYARVSNRPGAIFNVPEQVMALARRG